MLLHNFIFCETNYKGTEFLSKANSHFFEVDFIALIIHVTSVSIKWPDYFVTAFIFSALNFWSARVLNVNKYFASHLKLPVSVYSHLIYASHHVPWSVFGLARVQQNTLTRASPPPHPNVSDMGLRLRRAGSQREYIWLDYSARFRNPGDPWAPHPFAERHLRPSAPSDPHPPSYVLHPPDLTTNNAASTTFVSWSVVLWGSHLFYAGNGAGDVRTSQERILMRSRIPGRAQKSCFIVWSLAIVKQ